ncbi:hypothetical protein AALO_G00193680 [Alosa alosa]|uniref:Uncharacterized protein n=1 Tax=Alosa alosa TaxID=278164 RepID=A0AAV6G8T9_9TELE|nr:hypothetical protein AALO_G00193680 [Alosa alosa]
MPDFCAAYGCANQRCLEVRTRGITFHQFYLAAMHFNENAESPQRKRAKEKLCTDKQFIIKDPVHWDAVQRIPVPQDLCAQLDRPSMEDAVAEHVSRFSQKGV